MYDMEIQFPMFSTVQYQWWKSILFGFTPSLFLQTIKQRRESGQRMNDLIDMMIDCMKDEATAEDRHHHEDHEEDQYEQDMRLTPHNKDSAGRR
jgi:hypothetical protein